MGHCKFALSIKLFFLPADLTNNVIYVMQDDVAACFEYNADLAEALDKQQKSPISLPMETFKSYILKEPIGVVGLITPWYVIFFYRQLFLLFSITLSLCVPRSVP